MTTTFLAAGRSIRMDAVEPRQPAAQPMASPDGRLPALLVLHGAGGNSGFWLDRLAPIAAQAGVHLYAPHYFDRTATIRADFAAITDGVHVPQWIDTLDHALHWVAARPAVDPARIGIVGVSLGAFLSLGFAAQLSASNDARERDRIRCLIEVSGGLAEPFASAATRFFPPTLLLHGEQDNVVPVAEAHALDARLTRLGVDHTRRILPGEGHWFSGAAQMQLLLAAAGFLQTHLAPAATTMR